MGGSDQDLLLPILLAYYYCALLMALLHLRLGALHLPRLLRYGHGDDNLLISHHWRLLLQQPQGTQKCGAALLYNPRH